MKNVQLHDLFACLLTLILSIGVLVLLVLGSTVPDWLIALTTAAASFVYGRAVPGQLGK